MRLKFGVDLVHIPRFQKTFLEAREYFREQVFLPEELEREDMERLAGIFAAKEAVAKALGKGGGRWKEIRILHSPEGKPSVVLADAQEAKWEHELSLSHDGGFVIAVVIFYQ